MRERYLLLLHRMSKTLGEKERVGLMVRLMVKSWLEAEETDTSDEEVREREGGRG